MAPEAGAAGRFPRRWKIEVGGHTRGCLPLNPLALFLRFLSRAYKNIGNILVAFYILLYTLWEIFMGFSTSDPL